MKIAYKKKYQRANLVFGLVWLVWFLIGVFGKEDSLLLDYLWGLASLLYLGKYFYDRKYKYVSLENGSIGIHGPLGKKLSLNKIKRIRKFARDYIIKTDKNELTINTQIIDSDSLAKLNKELEKLHVEWA